MKYIKIALISFLAGAMMNCANEKKKPVYEEVETTSNLEVQTDDTTETNYAQSGQEIIVPFRNENGVKFVQVKVNGVGFDMIFDTGCSGALISVAEANYLYQKGKLTEEDFLGTERSQIADGSIVEDMVVNLKEVVINDQILCPNVQATVSSNINAPLLLGNEVLDRLATITIDNTNETLNFKLK